ncbi:hypothetical protein [Micromonospora sp. WMMD975]|uniref:hypothetical protein n=1 Tax=Micromonospora sp. WMMD975 TaxID=3016087 RepID=UPI00249AE336|nr:hypothetical protein [Micromonospora sp. WMMD975]WFE34141.1 hypothetical protein O7613_01705 [Micromonospora sp. WMMD975]
MILNMDKSSWKRVTFGDVVQNLNSTVRDARAAGIDRVIAMEHLDPGKLKISRWGSIEDGSTFTRRVKPGQTLFGKRRAYQRKAAFADFDAITSGDILVFEADAMQLLPEFLPFLVQSDGFYEHALGTSAGSLSPRTNWRDLADYEFSLPPLEEQRHLARLFWAVERHRCRLSDLVPLLTRGYDGWLVDRLSSFPTRLLGEVVELQQGRPVPSELYGKGDFPLLRPGDMRSSGRVEWSASSVRIPQSFADSYSSWILRPGDLVINMTAQSLEGRFLGRVCRMHDVALLNQRIGRLSSRQVSKDYLFVALRSPEFCEWVARRSEGSKVQHMHWRHIEDYPLPCPDDATQCMIASEDESWSVASRAVEAEMANAARLQARLSAEIFRRPA